MAETEHGGDGRYTIEDYAEEKSLSAELLLELGVTENGTGIVIPYYNEDGRHIGNRYRGPGRKMRTDPGQSLPPYGLDRLDTGKSVLLVEGESDCHAAWQHEMNVIGIPGTAVWRADWAQHIRDCPGIYIWQEPDEGGAEFVRRISRSFPEALVLQPPRGCKDVCELHARHPRKFRARMAWLAKKAQPAPRHSQPVLTRLSEVEGTDVDWMWHRRVPYGKLTMLDGDPGLGKSTLTLELAARLSTGAPMPDCEWAEPYEPRGTVVMAAEDSVADTMVPRLDMAGADKSRIVALERIRDESGERPPVVEDAAEIAEAVESVDAGLIIIDPIMAYLGQDANRDQDVRLALARIIALAEDKHLAVILVRHLNKNVNVTNPLYRGGGSIGFIGAVRSGLVIAEHPEIDDRRVLAQAKNNLARKAPSLVFSLREEGGIEWHGRTNYGAEYLLRQGAKEEAGP